MTKKLPELKCQCYICDKQLKARETAIANEVKKLVNILSSAFKNDNWAEVSQVVIRLNAISKRLTREKNK